MSEVEEACGEPVAKKMKTSSMEDPAATSLAEPVAMATSLVPASPPASVLEEMVVPSTEITLKIPMVTESLKSVTTTVSVPTLGLVTMGQEPSTKSAIGTESSVVMTTVGKTTAPPGSTTYRPVTLVTNGNIRPSIQISQGDTTHKTTIQTVRLGTPVVSSVESNPGHSRPTLQINTPGVTIPVPQTWTTFQISPSSARPLTQTKWPLTLPSTLTPGTQRYQSPQVVTLQHRLPTPTSILTKPLTTRPAVTTDIKFPTQTIQHLNLSQVEVKPETSLTSPTQISIQMPVKWNTAGSKSLLDNSNKLSMVNLNTTEAKSLLQDSKVSVCDNQAALSGTSPKTYVTGGKVIGSLTAAQIITQNTSGHVAIPRTATVVTNPTLPQKFVINNKTYPTQVVTQIVKTDANKSKITMAEAQIMLPSGPAKISWPVHSQVSTTESKQILITSPMIKSNQLQQGKTYLMQRPGTTVALSPTGKVTNVCNIAPTAKVVGSPASKVTIQGNQPVGTTNVTPTKMSVLPAQKNWELIKQAQQLMPRKIDMHSPGKAPAENTKTTEQKKPAKKETNGAQSNDPIKVNELVKVKQETIVTSSVVSSTDTYSESNKSETATDNNNKVEEKTVCEAAVKTVDTPSKDAPEKSGEKTDGTGDAKESTEVKMEVGNSGSGKTQLKIKGGEVTVKQEDFDPVDAMDWNDGVGELPGSDLKFRVNDLGALEVISDDLECTETLNTSNESEVAEPEKDAKKERRDIAGKIGPKTDPNTGEVSNKDEITQCENCGEYGFATDFYKEGRFCSQTCVGAFDSKRMRGVKKHGTMSKVVLGLKKGRKKFLLKDGVNRDKDLKPEQSMLGKKSKAFVWTKYLEREKATEAPARLFKNPFPSAKNQFRVGMKLEGVDLMHQSLFCVLTVAEVCGYRVRLHFDGYSECFDFWTDVDSCYIFPVGFCEKNGKILQPPKGFAVEDFSWANYLKLTKGIPASKTFFSNQPVQPVTPNLFRIGSKLEAVDKKNSSLICVASVADTLSDKVLIHFDSWDDNYDYWCDMTSPFIHPTGYCEENNIVLSPPIDWKDPHGFTWDKFLNKTKSQAVPARAFKPRSPVGFEVGMKVEVVDKRNPLLVRVATVAETESYMLRIHFDGWSDMYDYWLDDDSPDLHPPGWCAKTGHPLVPPITPSDLVVNSGPGICPTPGCKGIGHIKGAKYSGHHSTFGCPYSELNMNKESMAGDRLGPSLIKDDPGFSAGRIDDTVETRVSSQPKLLSTPSEEMPKKFGRGRRPKSYYLHLEEQKREREQERLEKEESLRQGIHNSVFTSSMISPAKSEVPLCWEQHSKLLPGVTNIRGNDVNKWTIEQVAAFVNTLPGCQEQAKLFKEEQIDGEAFLLLTQSDIVKIMNIKLGPALKIFNSIIMFKNSVEV